MIYKTEQNRLLEQIPKPHVQLGDINSHHTTWGCKKTIKKGKDLEYAINNALY